MVDGNHNGDGERSRGRDIAIVGLAGRFPGAADPSALWRNLRDGVVSSRELDETTLEAAGVPESVRSAAGYVRRKPVLDDIDRFDAGFFGLLPREAALLDPAHRLFLECAWLALEDAGHGGIDGEGVGVYAGTGVSTYLIRNLLRNRDLVASTDMSQLVFATDKDHLAMRTAYELDLKGPCVAVSTACSTSLVAVHMACRGLLSHQCDLALSGGASVFVPQGEGYPYREGGMASPDGHCRPFDAEARGTVFGSGAGVVALKRFEDAEADGDFIYGVIRGSAINNDGADKIGYTAPGVAGQAAVIAEALAVAGVNPEEISYVEAHGTGTRLGDPIEIRALNRAFGDNLAPESCAIGSIKANIGHLDAASGVSGLMKCVLALTAGQLPPTPHYARPNPEIDFAAGPFRVNDRLQPWASDGRPRRCGVSSFGIGGSNVHVVLEEAPSRDAATPSPRSTELLVLSARSEEALDEMALALADFLTVDEHRAPPDLADVAFTLATGRKPFEHRLAVTAATLEEAVRQLRQPRSAPWRGRVNGEGKAGPLAAAATRDPAGAGRHWCAGGFVDWKIYYGSERRHRLPLPGYRFQRQRHWIDPDPAAGDPFAVDGSVFSGAGTAAVAAPPAVGGVDLRQRLLTMVSEVAGIPVAELETDRGFLEMGLDSLTLIQLNRGIKSKLGIDVPYHLLMEEHTSIDALAAHLQSLGPAPSQPEPVTVAPPAGSRRPVSTPAPVRHGPIRTPERAADTSLTAAMRDHLDALVKRIAARTPNSKRLAQRYRRQLADPRIAVGFNRLWKEIVYPLTIVRAAGSRVVDADGGEYIDLIMGFGVHLFGHHPSFVTEAVTRALRERSQMVGPHGDGVGEVARLLCELTGNERVSFCNTGSEAVMAAIRIARTATDRSRIVLFDGSYHGNFDAVLVRRAGERTLPVTLGIPQSVADEAVILDYGADESLSWLRDHGDQIAAVLVEPVQCRRIELQPLKFLKKLRRITEKTGALLIFDEVVTGFRIHPGGAQAWFGIRADLATYGKVLGGGLPIGAVAGKSEYMDAVDGGWWQFGDDSLPIADQTAFAGTFCKHPLAMAAARAVLEHLRDAGPALQERLAARTAALARDLNARLAARGAPIEVRHFASIFFFTPLDGFRWMEPFWFHLREAGISVWGERPYFLSTAHDDEDLSQLCRAVSAAVDALIDGGFIRSPQPTPLTDAQREVWVACGMGEDIHRAFNTVSPLRLHGPVDAAALEAALNEVVRRHEALRTVFDADGERQRLTTVNISLIRQETIDEAGLRRFLRERGEEPFDLERGPLLRAALLRLHDREWVLVLTTHHLICDGLSLDVLLSELMSLYSGRVGGTVSTLPAPMPFSKYAAWLRDRRQGPDGAATDAWWRQRFRDGVPILELPLDAPRPPVLGARGERVSLTLAAESMAALRRVGAARGATPFVTLLACFQLLLHRLSRQSRLVVGVPLAGQARTGNGCLVGHCVNLVPVLSDLTGDPPFTDHLLAVSDGFHETQRHGDVTAATLVELLDLPRDPSRPPLCAVTFNLETPPERLRFGELLVENIPVAKPFVQFELVCNAYDGADGLHFECDFNSDLFHADTVRRWFGHLQRLIEAVVADPRMTVDRLPLLSTAERLALLEMGRPTPVAAKPLRSTIHGWFDAIAGRTPTALAVTAPEDDGPLTYGQLRAGANRLAHHLLAGGIGRGDRVAVLVERTPRAVSVLLAVLKSGAAYVPLDPRWPAKRMIHMLSDARVAALVTDGRSPEWGDGLRMPVIVLDAIEAELETRPDSDPAVAVDGGDPAYVIFTSGSTGRPKGVAVDHANVTRLFSSSRRLFAFDAEDRWSCVHSLAFDFSVWEIWGALLHGGRLLMVPHWLVREPPELLALLDREGITVLNQTPSAFRQLVTADDRDGPPLTALRLVIFGGEALDFAGLRPWFDRRGDQRPQLINMYGITETTVHVTHRRVTRADLQRSGSRIGAPLDDLTVQIIDDHGQPVPVGVAGELMVGGAGLARGYLFQPAMTAQRYIPDPFGAAGERLYRTGDRGRWLPDGDIEYLGRIDQQVQLHGYRIEPGEIETVLGAHAVVREVAVTLREDRAGTRLVAHVVADESLETAELRAHAGQSLPAYMIPSLFVRLPALPRSATGKIDRNRLPDPEEAGGDAPESYHPPGTEIERILADLWAEALDRPRVGIHDNFFELGGDSIITIRIVSRARRHGLRFKPADLYNRATIAGLATVVDRLTPENGTGEADIAEGEVPLTPIQHWFFQRRDPTPNRFSQAVVLEMAAGVTLEAEPLRAALADVMAHHDVFRLRFQRNDGGWRSFYGPLEPAGFEVLEAGRGETPAVIDERARTALDPGNGVLLQVRLVRGSDGEKLLLAAHHLAVDGVTWGLLLEELESAYRARLAGETPQLPPVTTSYGGWARTLPALARDPKLAADLDWWLEQGDDGSWPTDLPADDAGDVASEQRQRLEIDAERSGRLLRDLPERFHARVDDLLVTALVLTLANWRRGDRVVLALEGHGRDGPAAVGRDPARCAGWFTAIYPLSFRVDTSAPAATLIKSVKECLRIGARRGGGYGLLRYLHPDPALRQRLAERPQPALLFNYLGRVQRRENRLFGRLAEAPAPDRGPESRRDHLFEVEALVVTAADGTARLRIDWLYSDQRHERTTVERLCRELDRHLTVLIDGGLEADAGGFTPSDFPDAAVSQEDLDAVLAEIGLNGN